DLAHGFLDLSPTALVALGLQSLIYPLAGVTLLFGNGIVVFYDLNDALKKGAELRLVAGLLAPV
ncbi:MAG: hypothetical protein R6V84_12940, partial [Desulfobacterales bacterium]